MFKLKTSRCGKLKRGRPWKEVDAGIIYHMLKNNVPVSRVARHLGIHRDTIYANFREVIDEGRAGWRDAWKKIADAMFAEFLEKKRLKEDARKKRRRSCRRF